MGGGGAIADGGAMADGVAASDDLGTGTLMRSLGAAAGGDAGVAATGLIGAGMGVIGLAATEPTVVCKSALAFCVPSTPQVGQLTVNGIRPLTGSTSNL